MFFHITHTTRFRYDAPVFLEPVILRLRPRCDCTQRLIAYTSDIEPSPAGRSACVDLDGNQTETIWFEELYDRLVMVTRSRLETLREHPFDLLLTGPDAGRLPFTCPPELEESLGPYRRRPDPCPEVDDLADELLRETDCQTMPFLTAVAARLQATCEQVIREEETLLSPAETLAAGRGACRDLAVLGMDLCRTVGLAARFVTGYHASPDVDGRHHLHAWFEVYLPGGGWRGFDPSAGLAVSDQHVALCAAGDPRQAAATAGSYRGTGIGSVLEHELVVESRS